MRPACLTTLGFRLAAALLATIALGLLGGCNASSAPPADDPAPSSGPRSSEPLASSAARSTDAPVLATSVVRWGGCEITRYAFIDDLAAAFTATAGVPVDIGGGGATAGIRSVVDGDLDVGGTCRYPLPLVEERAVRLVPVAWDALVVIVHRSNPIARISTEQLRAVLTGRISTWAELGGPRGAPIRLLDRRGKISGVGRMARELLFQDPEIDFSPNAISFDSSEPLEARVEVDPLAIAVDGVSSAQRRKVKIVPVDGVSPTYEHIASGRYPFVRPLYLVLQRPPEQPTPASHSATRFVAFALSDVGQAIIRRAGTVNLEDGAALWPKFRRTMVAAGVQMGLYDRARARPRGAGLP